MAETNNQGSFEDKKICGKCQSPLVVRLGNQDHCVQCGLDFNQQRNVARKSVGAVGTAPRPAKEPVKY